MSHASANETDDDGWIMATCTCGWRFGPCPDEETATDALMDHAFAAGAREFGRSEPQ